LSAPETERRKKLALEQLAGRLSLIEESKGSSLSGEEIWREKLRACNEFGLDRVPKNSEIFERLPPSSRAKFQERLRRKSVRTRSGIAVVTVITKPFDCPHGTCTFCPGGVRFGTPQSYTRNSPAASFGLWSNFDPARQVREALEALERNGHDTSKVELILLGGTVLAMPKGYQAWFVKESYDALNQQSPASDLAESMKRNERSDHRCVGLTIETKPDWCREEHVDVLLSYGATRVEIGMQSLRAEVLKFVNRGHTVSDSVRALRVSKDAAFKVVAHMMPGLPLSNPEKDLEDLVSLVRDERFRPDMLKIYPTLVVEGTALYNQYKVGKYVPCVSEDLVELLCKFKREVPSWMRIMRIQREIPRDEIAAGSKAGNLRQMVLDRMKLNGLSCRCIRCREVGHRKASSPIQREQVEESSADPDLIPVSKTLYEASGGQEVFLAVEESPEDTLYGFLRLRIPSGEEHRQELRADRCALIRELHVYGSVVPLGAKSPESDPTRPQHRGLGTRLLAEAEKVASEEFGRKKVVVISAVGTKEYYRKRGYRDDGPYVSKWVG
jgi:elongator complex protein 3